MNETSLLVDQRASVLWLTIDRPPRRNAMNAAVLAQMSAALDRAALDAHIRSIVITGAGDQAFCSGADLSEDSAGFNQGVDVPTTNFGRFARLARNFPKPMIARVNGDCLAGGMGILALCDLAICADHARFGLPEVKLGLFPMQVTVWLRHLIAPRHLRALAFTGAMIGAFEAREIGLVNEIAPREQLDKAVISLCETLAQCSPQALQRGKHVLNAMEDMSFEAAIGFAEAQITLTAQTNDAKEGVSAFREKRAPKWTQPQN